MFKTKIITATLLLASMVALLFPFQARAATNETNSFGFTPSTGFPAIDKFLRDPLGNGIAVVVLLILLLNVIWILISLVTGQTYTRKQVARWVIPLLSVIGFGISFYMAFVETTRTQAYCGPIGDCNTVQQSRYARVFGFLPVGILGVIGYLALLIAWVIYQYGPTGLKSMAGLTVWGMALFGNLFSIYLTFLEPFVIGATCMWCIFQAIVILLMMWATTSIAQPLLQIEPED